VPDVTILMIFYLALSVVAADDGSRITIYDGATRRSRTHVDPLGTLAQVTSCAALKGHFVGVDKWNLFHLRNVDDDDVYIDVRPANNRCRGDAPSVACLVNAADAGDFVETVWNPMGRIDSTQTRVGAGAARDIEDGSIRLPA
jgi:hypothetical protein